MSALLIALATMPVTAESPGWGQIVRGAALLNYYTEVTVGTLSPDAKSSNVIWLRKFETGQPLQWTDTRRCPAANRAIAAMRTIPVRAEPPAESMIQISDGVDYSLDAPAAYGDRHEGRLRLRSKRGSALATWVETTLKALAPCWSTEPPALPDR